MTTLCHTLTFVAAITSDRIIWRCAACVERNLARGITAPICAEFVAPVGTPCPRCAARRASHPTAEETTQ